MLIYDLQTSWLAHSFWRRRFVIEDQRMIARLRHEGIGEVVIDIANGLDVDPAMLKGARTTQRHAGESMKEAHRDASSLQHEAMQTVHRLLSDARLGRQVDIQRAEPMIEKMMHSVLHHRDALHPLLQLKSHDLYSYQHSISVAAMAVALGTTLGFDQETLRQTALGVLLQDIGKVRIPNCILAKPGRLDADETNVVRRHVLESQIILADAPGTTELMLEIVMHHHERIDGTGYPNALSGEQIPIHAQLAAIVDVYDALTSNRPHQRCIEPAEALGQLHSMANSHFREDLLRAFIQTIGIYPAGSLVRLDNDSLAIVIETNRDAPYRPVVQVIQDARDPYTSHGRHRTKPYLLNLKHPPSGSPSIVSVESYAHWDIPSDQAFVAATEHSHLARRN